MILDQLLSSSCVCAVVTASDYDKHSLLARYGSSILRPHDLRKVQFSLNPFISLK